MVWKLRDSLNSVSSTDAAFSDLQTSLSSLSSSLGSSSTATASELNTAKATSALARVLQTLTKSTSGVKTKDLSSDITNQISKIKTDFQKFPTTKSLNESINLTGDSLSSYFKLTTATATLSAALQTTDGNALVTSTGSNFKSANGKLSLALVVDPYNWPTSNEEIKDFRLRLNAGGTASVGAQTVNGSVEPANLVFDYGESAVLGISFANSAGAGGKVIISANSKNSGTIANPVSSSSSSSSALEQQLIPTISITIAVYDDSGNAKYSKTWTDLSTFESDFDNATTSE